MARNHGPLEYRSRGPDPDRGRGRQPLFADERMGEVGMAFVVAVPGAVLDADGLIEWSREKMANYKVPRHIEIVETLPSNASGKVLKFELRKRASELVG